MRWPMRDKVSEWMSERWLEIQQTWYCNMITITCNPSLMIYIPDWLLASFGGGLRFAVAIAIMCGEYVLTSLQCKSMCTVVKINTTLIAEMHSTATIPTITFPVLTDSFIVCTKLPSGHFYTKYFYLFNSLAGSIVSHFRRCFFSWDILAHYMFGLIKLKQCKELTTVNM